MWTEDVTLPPPTERLDAHCGRKGCLCVHDRGCYRGWMDSDTATRPCPVCRETLTRALEDIPQAGKRSPADLARLRDHARDDRWQEAS